MIAQESIDKIKEISLLEVVAKDVTMKRKGANHVGSCPFHDEKSSSFTVSPSKGIYKCFGCGAGGNNPINFVMAKKNMPFDAAVRYLADLYSIPLEETRDTEEAAEQKEKRMDLMEINKFAGETYRKYLLAMINQESEYQPYDYRSPVAELLQIRQLSMDTVVEFGIGFSPKGSRLVAQSLKERGLLVPGEELGLVKVGENGSYDIYRDRIIFPIHNERGEVVGFGGRKMEDGKKENPKYINSRDSLVYKKEFLLYGLYQAGAAIRKAKYAILTEGYYDVCSFHDKGVTNTVASCGTALTEGHAKILKKYCSHIILIRDGDSAGNKANMKDIDMLLRFGFKVELVELPKGEDPDSFSRSIGVPVAVPEPVEEMEESPI